VNHLARVGDVIRFDDRPSSSFTIGPHPSESLKWWRVRVLHEREITGQPIVFGMRAAEVEQHLAMPGALVGFADPWSTWAEGTAE
jgi:hypothetical protein